MIARMTAFDFAKQGCWAAMLGVRLLISMIPISFRLIVIAVLGAA